MMPTKHPSRTGTSQFAADDLADLISSKTSAGAANTFSNRLISEPAAGCDSEGSGCNVSIISGRSVNLRQEPAKAPERASQSQVDSRRFRGQSWRSVGVTKRE